MNNRDFMNIFLLLFCLLWHGRSEQAISANEPAVNNQPQEYVRLVRSLRKRFFRWKREDSDLTTENYSWLDAQQFGGMPIFGKKTEGYLGKKGGGYHYEKDDDDHPSMPIVIMSPKPIVAPPAVTSKPVPVPTGPSKPTPAPPTPVPTIMPVPAPPTPAPTMMPVLAPPTTAPTTMPIPAPPTPAPTMMPVPAPPTPAPAMMPIPAPPTPAPTMMPVPAPPTPAPTMMPIPAPPTPAPTIMPVPAPPTPAPTMMQIPAPPTPAPIMMPVPAPPTPAPTIAILPTMGPTVRPCPPNTVQETSPGFGGQDPSRYNIWLDLDLSSNTVTFYSNARTIWESIIIGDTGEPIDVTVPPEFVGPAGVPNPVDDIYISGTDLCIDGPGKVLGRAAPLFLREGLPASGFMQFDTDDVGPLGASFETVILHEMGHVLGIGTLWNGLLSDDRRQYVGANGLRVWQMTFGCPGNPLIENGGGPGTAGGHWEEDTTDPELMTGGLNSTVTNPLSELSIAALQDLGYAVDYAPAEPFCPPPAIGCTCRGSILTEVEEKPPLSLEGYAAAQAHGFSVLLEVAESCAAIECNVGIESEGLTFVGDKLVVVLYQENDYIYEVFVRARA